MLIRIQKNHHSRYYVDCLILKANCAFNVMSKLFIKFSKQQKGNVKSGVFYDVRRMYLT